MIVLLFFNSRGICSLVGIVDLLLSMAKTSLTFKVNNRSIKYEGHVENRPKDLMEVLAKLGVEESTVVDTFRANIDNHENFNDDEIVAMFSSARAVRAARQARHADANAGVEATKPPAETAAAVSQQQEEKVRITLHFLGKNYAYMGYPSAKKTAVLQLLTKNHTELTYDIALATYRENLPGEQGISDEEAWEEICNAIEAKTGQRPVLSNQAEAEEEEGQGDGDEDYEDEELRIAISKYNAIPKEEHDEIRGFIRQVLDNSDGIPGKISVASPTAMAVEDTLDCSVSGMIGSGAHRGANGRIAIYCQETGPEIHPTKVIYSTADVTFEDLKALVAKKYETEMDLSFKEDEDIVEIDDDDVLGMFLDILQRSNRKMKLLCTKHCEKRQESTVNNSMTTETETKEKGAAPAAAFSNGDLEVSLENTFSGHTQAVYSCAFSLAGDRFVSASRDRSVRVWTVNGRSEPSIMRGGHNGLVLSCDFSPVGTRVVSSSEDKVLKVWNTRNCSKCSTLRGHTEKVYCVEYSPTGDYIVSGSCDNTVRVWSAEDYRKEATLKGHTLAVFSCGFSKADRGKRVVSGSDDRRIKLWDWEAGKEIRTLSGHLGTIWSVAFSHNDKYIVSTSMDRELRLWLADTGECVRSLAGHNASIHQAIFSSNDKYILSCARDCCVKIWRTEDGELIETILAHGSTVFHMALHGEHLLTSSQDTTLKLWRLKNLLA